MPRRGQFRISLSPRFRGELKHQIAWIAERDRGAALAAEGRVRVAVRRLGRFPYLARSGRVEDTRELSVPKTRFIIAYRVREEERIVEVAALRHSSQLWPTDL